MITATKHKYHGKQQQDMKKLYQTLKTRAITTTTTTITENIDINIHSRGLLKKRKFPISVRSEWLVGRVKP